jgi:UDP-glucose 4-epimerase
MGMNYLITGIAGFVGSSLARSILTTDPESRIVGIDNFSFGYPERISDIKDRINFIEGDLINLNDLVEAQKFDAIIHCAAIAPLPECQLNSYRALNQNVAICGSILDFALKSGSRNIVFFSSGAIYEGVTEFPTPENVKIVTSLTYPSSKYLAEVFFESFCRSHEINVTAIRLFNLYGPYQDYFRKQPPLIGYLLKCIIQNEQAILYSSGEQSRDYIFIDDLLKLVLLSANKMNNNSLAGTFLAINAGSGASVSVNSIISILENISGKKLEVKRLSSKHYWDKYPEIFDKPIHILSETIEKEVNKFTQACTIKVMNELNWSASVSLEDGLRLCFEHAKKILKGKN